jgi:hypothetical protein
VISFTTLRKDIDFSSGTGVPYATFPQGTDHSSGLIIHAKIDHFDPTIQVEASRRTQINTAEYNTLCVCAFAMWELNSRWS